MKKLFSIVVLSGLAICSFLNVCAQERTVSESELNALKDKAYEKLSSQTYRVVMNSNHYKNVGDSSPYISINEIIEYVPPARRHRINERINEKGTIREETISIGDCNN